MFTDPLNPEAILHKLIDLRRPLLHIPNLAIHLESERSKFEFNTEQHLRPILAHIACEQHKQNGEKCKENGEKSGNCESNKEEKEKDKNKNCQHIVGEHHELFLKVEFDDYFKIICLCLSLRFGFSGCCRCGWM